MNLGVSTEVSDHERRRFRRRTPLYGVPICLQPMLGLARALLGSNLGIDARTPGPLGTVRRVL